MVIAQALLDDVVAHAREEYDAECCGMLAYEQSDSAGSPRAVGVHRAKNIHATDGGSTDRGSTDRGSASKRFEIDGREVLGAINEFEDAGWELGAIYHSHTHTEPYPSQTDINFARNWPGVEWLIVGLAGEEPQVRCFMIEDGEVREVPLEVG
ncbi:MAG TPA: M67 family metallopeptidase [Solirubrobacteraceae bacterium]|jgi:proteasome lid subunit RPN8/RPN11|nr:M67 family metallopeptidase [Solirubrobacteraceae bacterium]